MQFTVRNIQTLVAAATSSTRMLPSDIGGDGTTRLTSLGPTPKMTSNAPVLPLATVPYRACGLDPT